MLLLSALLGFHTLTISSCSRSVIERRNLCLLNASLSCYTFTPKQYTQDVNENQWQYLTKYFSAPPGPKVIKCGAIQSA